MGILTDVSDEVVALRRLIGDVRPSDVLPVVEHLDDDTIVTVMEGLVSASKRLALLQAAVSGVIARRSDRRNGHSGLSQSRGHRSPEALIQHITGTSRAEAAKQVRVGTSLLDSEPGETPGILVPVDPASPVQQGGGGTDAVTGTDSATGAADDPRTVEGSSIAGASEPWHAPLRRALQSGRIGSEQYDAIAVGLGEPPSYAQVLERMGDTVESHASAERANRGRAVDDCTRGDNGIPDDGTDNGLADGDGDGDGDGRASSTASTSAARLAGEFARAWHDAAAALAHEAPRIRIEELRKSARALRDRLDPVGAEARYRARYDARSFRIWTDREGMRRGSFVFDDEAAATMTTIIETALRPRRGGPRFMSPEESARSRSLREDPRTNEQLSYDLVLDLIRAGALADCAEVFGARQAGVRIVQTVTAASDGSYRPAGPAHLEDDGTPLPSWVAAQRACTAGIVPATFDENRSPLSIGRQQRLFTAGQRIALALRDGGCRWPGCERTASYCEAHHIDAWADGGRTDVDRGILLCAFHHLQLHNNRWRITRDGTGDFMLHHPGGGTATVMPVRLQIRAAWAGIPFPRRRFRLAA